VAEKIVTQRIVIAIGGGIAAYKVCEVISSLVKTGAEVRVILTESAQEFITPLTVATLSRHPAYTDQDFWAPTHQRPLHIDLGEWATLILLAPLTAHTLGKLAQGLADDLLTNTILASTCPVLLAPAMNTAMWQQLAVQRNWELLRQDTRFHAIGPDSGLLACDTVGAGRMAEPQELLAYLESLGFSQGKRDLLGKTLLISGGGTREYLDPVRFLGNPSTGKMGIALARAAKHRGAEVTLICGPTSESLPLGITSLAVVSAAEMQAALLEHFAKVDWLIMAAAVGDVKPSNYHATKLPKHLLPTELPLTPIPDILAELSLQQSAHQRLIGFAAQTDDIVAPAKQKLIRKKLDVIAANPVDLPDAGFGSPRNQAMFLDRLGRVKEIPACSKLALAHQLISFVREFEQSQVWDYSRA
jgi:phosphopantothenoylcysteine decarboxylase / phosphopantothenate---cysteine ligase